MSTVAVINHAVNPPVSRELQAALSALDVLVDTADRHRRFELRAIASKAFFALDGYAAERDDPPAPRICETCDAGYHEVTGRGCACPCHRGNQCGS